MELNDDEIIIVIGKDSRKYIILKSILNKLKDTLFVTSLSSIWNKNHSQRILSYGEERDLGSFEIILQYLDKCDENGNLSDEKSKLLLKYHINNKELGEILYYEADFFRLSNLCKLVLSHIPIIFTFLYDNRYYCLNNSRKEIVLFNPCGTYNLYRLGDGQNNVFVDSGKGSFTVQRNDKLIFSTSVIVKVSGDSSLTGSIFISPADNKTIIYQNNGSISIINN